jgi:limonene 1,2-monooxygenase
MPAPKSAAQAAATKTTKPKNGAAHTHAPKIALQDRFIKTGVFLAPFHALNENPTLAIERDVELVQHLDRLNYHEAWIGEHHSAGFEIIASPEMFIAGVAPVTRNIRLGTGVVSLPYHNPFTLASRMIQLDHQTRGRAMFGVGPGSLIYDAEKIGLKAADQRRRMDESLDVLMRLMRNEAVTQKTDWYNLNEARLQLQPYSQPMMEMAVAASRSPVGYVASGKHGLGMLSIGGTSDAALQAYAQNWGIHEETAHAAGQTPDRRKWRIVTFAHVAETREQAKKEVEFGLKNFVKYFNDVATFPIVPPGVTDPYEFLTKEGVACIGTPDDCIRHFERIWQGSQGGCGAILLLAHNWADWQATFKSYELMARFVHPHFQKNSNAQRVWSYDDAAKKHETAGAESQAAVQREIEKYAAAKGKAAGPKSW